MSTEITTLVFAALVVESVINIVQNIQEKETSWKYWASLVLGVVASVLVSWNWNLDIFTIFGMPMGRLSLVGPILTGLVISRGSNVVSDFLGLINNQTT